MMRRLFLVPGLEEESVLNEDSDDEEDNAFHCHGEQVFTDHVPLQRRPEPVLTWRTPRSTRKLTQYK